MVKIKTAKSLIVHSFSVCLLLLSGACSAVDEPALRYLDVDGQKRSYLVYLPPAYENAGALSLVLVYHGGMGNAEYMEHHSRMNEVAEVEGFVVVYPNGVGQPRRENRRTWYAGGCCGNAKKTDADDLAFTRSLIEELDSNYDIDRQRVFATGMSNGGMFVYRLACELSDQIAAIAPVSGTLIYSPCSPANPIAVMHVHGTADENVPEAGGKGSRSITRVSYQSVDDSLTAIRKIDHCDGVAEVDSSEQSLVLTRYQCQYGEVEYLQIVGGEHAWAIGDGEGKERRMSQRVWDFFAAQQQ